LQTDVALGAVRALPPTITELHLSDPSPSLLAAALERFPQLQALSVCGSWDWMASSWRVPHCLPAVPKLHTLSLDYQRLPDIEGDDSWYDDSAAATLPADISAALAPASALHTLELRVHWSDEVSALCRAMPGLRNLR